MQYYQISKHLIQQCTMYNVQCTIYNIHAVKRIFKVQKFILLQYHPLPPVYLRMSSKSSNMMISYPNIMKMNISLPASASQNMLVPVHGCNPSRMPSHSSDNLSVCNIPELNVPLAVPHSQHVSFLGKKKQKFKSDFQKLAFRHHKVK